MDVPDEDIKRLEGVKPVWVVRDFKLPSAAKRLVDDPIKWDERVVERVMALLAAYSIEVDE
jgi:hypothetical protein